jgi:hypothetical protein
VYLIARLIAWIEVLKREQIFLDFATVRETRRFNSYLELIYSVLSYSALTGSDSERSSGNHWIYYHYLGGIGESLFVRNDDAKLRCITFHEFCQKYRTGDTDFHGWIREVENLVLNLSCKEGDVRWRRLQMLQVCLDQFLDFADPKRLRTTRNLMDLKGTAHAIRDQVMNQARHFRLRIR